MRRRAARIVALGAFLGCFVGAFGEASARAQLTYELAPAVGVGATDNAELTTGGELRAGAGFGTAGAVARAHYQGARVSHALGARLTLTRYVDTPVPDAIYGGLAWMSSYSPTAALSLQLRANADLSRVSNVDPANPELVAPSAALAGTNLYLYSTVAQDLLYQPTGRRTYAETISVSQVRFFQSVMPLPTTTLVTGGVRGTRLFGRDAYSVDLSLGDSITSADPAVPQETFSTGHTLLAQGLAGWRHQFGATWSTRVEAGPSVLFKVGGPGVIAPAAVAAVGYARVPWFASLTASQTPAANIYFGDATINDQLIVRVGLPLTRSELVYVGGYGSYIYARIANADLQLQRDFDQLAGGLSLFARFRRLPFSWSLSYLAMSQRGSSLPGHAIPDIARQAVMINLAGTFAWGPGTPPLFGGVL